jgi:hypothetical protein
MGKNTLLLVVLAGALVGACAGNGNDESGPEASSALSTIPVSASSTSTSSIPSSTGLGHVEWPRVIDDLDCSPINAGVEVVSTSAADVTGDEVEDAFVWVVCVHPTSGWPHQLEVFDGSSDPARPTQIGVLVPAADNLRGGALSFSAGTVTVRANGFAELDPNCCPSLEIVQSFTWDGNGFVAGERTVRPKP